ncbi:tripartite motif-containing protein 42 [Tympanuchus pallidicinctus]|uniref:tripartite motif-containing protein 42 n=1 Tax=Tympanuchus pallidicinctus TaxID=109042 RepID=UPI002286E218|nr:tripartite motif-containing protein 42 [Tympanuchus pallidicinctus]
MDENGCTFSACPCFSNCCYLTCHRRKKECCLCWRFLFTSEQNCSCFPCPYEEDKPYQCCHCSCSEHANCWWCCCSCSNDPDCKCCCCGGENSACQYYASKCCGKSVYDQQQSRAPGTVQLTDVMSRLRTRNKARVSVPERKGSNQAFRDQLACPLCKQLFLQPFMLPCNHCICEKCIIKTKTKAEATDNYYIIICPVCNKAHCLPNTNKIQLRKNYLKAKLAKKYMRRHGILKWRFDHSERPVYCETCRERRRVATKRCRTCGINMCSECLHLYHTESGVQDHIFTSTCQEDNEQWACLLHCNSHLSEYCLDDHKLICGFCKNSLHSDHETIPLAAACSREAASLSNTIVKFKQARQGIDNDLMEVTLLKNNFQASKDLQRKEIRNGFLKLHTVLHEQEKEMMELLENTELKKQKDISEYVNYTFSQLSYMDGLIQYAEEALKEESQVVFLQSAHCLVKEIEDAIPSIFQPSPHIREDPLRKLQFKFDELFAILQGFSPTLSETKQLESKGEKHPYSFNPEIMVPRHVSSIHEAKQSTMLQSASLNSLLELGMPIESTLGRPNSTPPHHSTQSNKMCAFWDAACETSRKERKYQIVNFPSSEPMEKESFPAPGPVVIYQTVVYPRSAKIYWTCPIEDVDFFEVEFYEVVGIGPDNTVCTQLDGKLSKIQQQNLEIRNLDSNTEYLFKVRAVNKSGQGEWSESCKIITSGEHKIIQDRWRTENSMQGTQQTLKR